MTVLKSDCSRLQLLVPVSKLAALHSSMHIYAGQKMSLDPSRPIKRSHIRQYSDGPAHKYVVHMSEQEAIDLGLFDFNADETTVMVDYKNKKRLEAYHAACAQNKEDLYLLKEHLNSLDDTEEPEYTHFDFPRRDFIRIWLLLR